MVSLAPHTTEWMYELDAIDLLVGVSEFSDYPQSVRQLPQVAHYQGVDYEAILQLDPDLILAWKGGNSPQDITRLQALGFQIFLSSPQALEDIPDEIRQLSTIIHKPLLGKKIADVFHHRLSTIKHQYQATSPVSVFYYVWHEPLMTIGKHAWANKLLTVCNAKNIFSDSPVDYPQIAMEKLMIKQPSLIIAANEQSYDAQLQFWQPWLPAMKLTKRHVRQVNPDLVHRFTSRTLEGLSELCHEIHTQSENLTSNN